MLKRISTLPQPREWERERVCEWVTEWEKQIVIRMEIFTKTLKDGDAKDKTELYICINKQTCSSPRVYTCQKVNLYAVIRRKCWRVLLFFTPWHHYIVCSRRLIANLICGSFASRLLLFVYIFYTIVWATQVRHMWWIASSYQWND